MSLSELRSATAAAPNGVIEILNRSGQVLQRIAVRGQKLSVGRAYDNDVIVGDPFVCPRHLEIHARDGTWYLEDLDSVNGTWLEGGRQKLSGCVALGEQTVQFGHSQLRFRPFDTDVKPAWRDTARHGLLSLFGRWWMMPMALVLCLFVLALGKLLDQAGKPVVGAVASDLVYPLLGLMLWAGFWAMLNRMISHRANFIVHLSIAAMAIVGLFVNAEGVPLLCFAFGWLAAMPWLKLTGQVLIVASALFAHLRYATHGKVRVQAVGSTILALLLIGSPVLGNLVAMKEFSSLPRLSPLLRPPSMKIVKGIDVKSFLQSAEPLRALDQDAAQEE
jgi:hypothetical protein